MLNLNRMKKICFLILVFSFFTLSAQQKIESPSTEIQVQFSLDSNGTPVYSVNYKGQEIVKASKMGISLKEEPALTQGFSLVNKEEQSVNDTWEPVLGEQSTIKNHYNQASFHLLQKETNRKLDIVFKVFDEGVAFRYEFPLEEAVRYFVISEENTEFNLTGDHKTFWIPGDFDSQEYVYNETKFSEIDNSTLDLDNGIALKSIKSKYRVQSPLMMKTDEGLYLNIFEAAVVNYPVMHLDVDTREFSTKIEIGSKCHWR